MKRIAKILPALMAAAMVLTSGCGAAPANSASPASPGAQAPAGPQKEIVLNFPCIWVAKDSKAKVFGEMVAKFNEDNKGKIKVVLEEQTDYQAYRDKLRTMVSTGNTPDIFTVDSEDDVKNFARSGKLLDMAPYMDDAWKGTFSSGAVENAYIEGKLFTLPYESATFPVMYNKKLLASVGYDKFPETYDELFACCEKLKAKGITPMSQMTGENAYTSIQWYSQAVLAIGGKDVYDRGLDDPAFVQAAEVVKKMFDYTTSDAIGAGAAISAGHFLNERTAIFLNGPWFFGRLPKEGAPGLYENVGLAYGPTFTGGKGEKNGMAGKPQAYVALGNQTDPAKAQAAIDFVKFITDPTWVAKLSESSGALFFVKTQAGTGMERLQAELVEMNNKAPYVGPTFQVMPVAVLTEFPQALDGLVTGEMTPQQFVDTLKPLAK